MKIHILAALLALLLLTAQAAEDKSPSRDDDDDDDDDITTLTFLVEYEPQIDNDHIEIGLTVQTKDRSLNAALKKAKEIVENIQTVAQAFCEENPEEGVNCDEVVDVQDFEIQAQYTKRRKQQVFEQFVVTHDITVSVYETDKIGELADKLLKTEVTKIESFDWQTDQDDESQEQAIEAGKQKSEDMCFHLGMKLHRIVSIEAVEDEDDEQAAADDQQEEEQDEQDQPLVYRFEVQCIEDAETEARKNKEEQAEDKEQAEEQQQEKKKKAAEEEQEERRKAANKAAKKAAPVVADKKKKEK